MSRDRRRWTTGARPGVGRRLGGHYLTVWIDGMALRWITVALTPIPIALDRWTDADPTLVFAAAAAGLIPLAAWVSLAVDDLAKRVGTLGGSLLNATFSNAAELIIALAALRAGWQSLVKASIAGTIVANVLLVIGTGSLAGGLTHKVQTFPRGLARRHAGMLSLAILALIVPTIFHHSRPGLEGREVHAVSTVVAVILLATYGLYLVYSLGTHRLRSSEAEEPPRWSAGHGLAVLAAAVGFVAWLSNILVANVQPVVERWGISELALGFVVVPLAGNAAEYAVTVRQAVKNKIDLAVSVGAASSIQVALLLAPLLVLLSPWVGQAPMALVFTLLEGTALGAAVAVANLIVMGGRSTWFEGVQLIAAYLIIAFAVLFS